MIKNRKYIIIIGMMAVLLMIFLMINQSNNNKIITEEETVANISSSLKEESSRQGQTGDSIDTYTTESINDTLQSETTEENQEIRLKSSNEEDITSKINELIMKYYDMTTDLDTKIFTTDKPKDLEEWTKQIEEKREIIETYKNLTVYNKPGLQENTYVIFTTYDMKLNNIDTLVPGMSVLIVVRDDNGEFLIEKASMDEKLTDYISQLTMEEEIKNIMEEVNANLKKAIKKDSSLKVFIEYLKETS